MMKTGHCACAALIAAALLAPIAAFAAEPWTREPKDFRGVPFGASRAEARAALDPGHSPDIAQRLTCTDGLLKDAKFMRQLSPSLRETMEREERERGTCSVMVAEIGPVMTKQTFTFHDDRFVQVELTFSSARFETLRDIFVERYGPPVSETTETVKTKAGASFENTVLLWTGEKVDVELRRYGGTIDSGAALVADRTWLDAEAKRRDAEKKKAAASF